MTFRLAPTGWLVRDGDEMGDHIAKLDPLIETNTHDTAIFRCYDQHVAAGEFVIDVGANHGVHSVYLAKQRGATVLAVEPQRPIAAQATANALLHGVIDRVHVVPTALWNTEAFLYPRSGRPNDLVLADGAVDYDASPCAGFFHLHEAAPTDTAQSFHAVSGDALVDDLRAKGHVPTTPVRFIKIDVEGADGEVIRGFKDILWHEHPFLLFEWKTGVEDYSVTRDDLWSLLETWGYQMPTSITNVDYLACPR